MVKGQAKDRAGDVPIVPTKTTMGDRMTRVRYRCSNPECKAEQTIAFFPDERVWTAIGCSDCTPCNGHGMTIQQMAATGRGMFPVDPVEVAASPTKTH